MIPYFVILLTGTHKVVILNTKNTQKKLTEYDCFVYKLTQHFRCCVSAIQKRLQHV